MTKSNSATRMSGGMPNSAAIVSSNLTGEGKTNDVARPESVICRGISNLYAVICSQVCRCTGLTVEEIFTYNRENCVDARYVLVYLLSEYLTDTEIARLAPISRTGANKIRNTFRYKARKFSVRCLVSEIRTAVCQIVSEMEA